MPKNATILIVEDDKFLLGLISGKLVKEGYDVIEALDGEEGIRLVQEKKPALVLLDLLLPGTDGFEVLKRMQEDKVLHGIPVVVLSNLGSREDIDRAKGLGAKDFLIKAHFTPAEIIEKVRDTIRGTYF